MSTLNNDHQVTRHINSLPDELLLYIYKCLPLETFNLCENVCERWSKLVNEPAAWRHIQIIYEGIMNQHEKSVMNNILSHSEQIQCLIIKYVDNYSMITSLIDFCKNLISLELYFCNIDKKFEDDILKLPKLRKLNLLQSLIVPDLPDILIQFDKLNDLNYLALSYWGMNINNCYTILQCTFLSHIFIDKIEEWNIDFIRLLILSRKEILKALHFYGGSSVDDGILQLLSQCPQLEYLSILNCRTLSDKGLLSLTSFKIIKHLELKNNSNFSKSALQRIFASTSLPTLECLILNFIQNITITVVDLISVCRQNLKFLFLNSSCCININYENHFKSKYGQDMFM